MDAELPYEEAMDTIKRLATRSASDMVLEDPEWICSSFEGLSPESIWDTLKASGDKPKVVIGDWRLNKEVDVYDVVLRFAESNFSRIRQAKFKTGSFAVIMANPLTD